MLIDAEKTLEKYLVIFLEYCFKKEKFQSQTNNPTII